MMFKGMKVALSAAGYSGEVAVLDYPQETIDAWITYGVRRWYQDNMNSAAKTLRDSGNPVDGNALFADRDKTAMEGAKPGRTAAPRKTKDALEPFFIQIMENNFRKLIGMQLAYPKGAKKADKTAFLREAFESMAEARQAWVTARVESAWLAANESFDLEGDLLPGASATDE